MFHECQLWLDGMYASDHLPRHAWYPSKGGFPGFSNLALKQWSGITPWREWRSQTRKNWLEDPPTSTRSSAGMTTPREPPAFILIYAVRRHTNKWASRCLHLNVRPASCARPTWLSNNAFPHCTHERHGPGKRLRLITSITTPATKILTL